MSIANEAEIAWLAVTFVNVQLVIAPLLTPSTMTSTTWKPVAGVMLAVEFRPPLCVAVKAPPGEVQRAERAGDARTDHGDVCAHIFLLVDRIARAA